VIAIGVLAVLGLWLWFDLGKPVREPGENPKIADLVGIVPADVSRINITNKSGTIELRKSGAAWSIESPAKYPADPDAAKRIIDGLLDRSTDYLAESTKDMAKYGLDKPQATVEFADSRATKRIQVGGKDASGSSSYALDSDGHRIFLVASSDAESLAGKTVGDLRDKTIVALPEGKIQSIEIRKGSGVVAMDRDNDKKWMMTQPWKAPADSFISNDIVGAFKMMKAERFVDTPDRAAADKALATPAMTVTIKEPGGKAHMLDVAAPLKGKTDRFARLDERRDEPVMLSDTTIRAFDKSASDLRSRQVIDFDTAKANRLKVVAPKGAWEIEKKGEEWQQVKSGTKVKRETVDGILADLTAATSKHLQEHPSNLMMYGLDKPMLTAEVESAGVKKTYRIGKKSTKYYANGSDTQAVFEIGPFTFDNLNKSADQLK
jgi:hypothetical protein